MKVIDSFSGEYCFLSNFYPCEMDVAGVRYPTLEHAFQAEKTVIPSERAWIYSAQSPGEAKKRGRKVTLRSDWTDVRTDVMLELLRIKFSDKVLRAELLATGDAKLVEGNTWRDMFWGVYQGKGENWLGRLLMQLREEIRVRQA